MPKLRIDLLIKELRPKQWLKNTVIFLPAIFADQFANGLNLAKLVLGFFLLSFVAGSLYIFNDIVDRKKDIEHPEKKYRPSPKDSSPKYTNALNTMSTYDRWKAEGPSLRQRVIETEKRAKLLFEFARKHRDDLGHTPLQREAWKNLHARYLTNFNSIRDNRNYEPHQFMDIWEQKLQDINNLLDRFTIEGKGIKNSAILKSDDGGQIA